MNSIKAFGETKIQTGDNSLPGLSATSTAGEESKCVKKRAKRDRFGARFNRIALSIRGRGREGASEFLSSEEALIFFVTALSRAIWRAK